VMQDGTRGGSLKLKIILPEQLLPDGEPLFGGGALYGSDMVFIKEAGQGHVKFVFEHFGSPHSVSSPIWVDRTKEHAVEITLPSFAPEQFAQAKAGNVRILFDDNQVLSTHSETYAFSPGLEQIGRNAFGTTCAEEFRGWMLEAMWVPGKP
jgi:hypothetical protein